MSTNICKKCKKLRKPMHIIVNPSIYFKWETRECKVKKSFFSLLTGTVIYTRRRRKAILNGSLAEQIDRIRVGSSRVRAHACIGFQALASAHKQHLMRRYYTAFPLDRLHQLAHATHKKLITHKWATSILLNIVE